MQAQEELKEIWSKTQFTGNLITCKSVVPGSEETPYHEYYKIKGALQHGRNSENHYECKEE